MFTKENPFLEIPGENVRISPFDIKEPTDYEEPENFPNCCDFHKGIVKNAETIIHEGLDKDKQFQEFAKKFNVKSSDYEYVIEKSVKQISYVEHHISEVINNEDWYDDITEYIDVHLDSFGSPSVGLPLFVFWLTHYVENTRVEIPEEKRIALSNFLKLHYNEDKKKVKPVETASLNKLHQLHQKWIKAFPFELSFFLPLKEHFEKRKPFLAEKPKTNRYSGITKAKMHTEESLIVALTELTKQLLSKIDTAKLVEEGQITNASQTLFEVIIQDRKAKNNSLLGNHNHFEQKYITTIKQWLNDEKEFFQSIKDLMGNQPKDNLLLTPNQKLQIAIKIFGLDEDYRKSLNSSDTIQPVYHHIPSVLKHYNLTPLQAAEIISDMRGSFSPESNSNVIDKIIDYLKERDSIKTTKKKKSKSTNAKPFKIKHNKAEIVRNIITELIVEFEFFKEEINTVDDFMVVFQSKQLNDDLPKIYLNCKNNEAAFVFRKLKDYIDNLSYANIGRTGLFIGMTEKPLTENDLSASLSKGSDFKRKEAFESLFKNF